MGVCMSKCYTEARRLNCWPSKTAFDDTDRLVDFDMFLDEQPAPRPLSMGTLLENEQNSSDVSLLHDSESEEVDVLFQLHGNDEIELHEEAAIEASQEALRMKSIAETSTELMDPAKLALMNSALWDITDYAAGMEKSDIPKSGLKRDGNLDRPSCSSPSSSVELEWENEDGLSPVTHVPGKEELSSDTASCQSQLSTPVSNGNEELEWDGHFTSTHISELDLETERLISEIERLTSGALQEKHFKR